MVTRDVAAVPGGVGKGIVRAATALPFASLVRLAEAPGRGLLPVRLARLTWPGPPQLRVGPAAGC